MSSQKTSGKQTADRVAAARAREAHYKAARERSERIEKVFTVVVAVVLVLALGIPTVALSLLGGAH